MRESKFPDECSNVLFILSYMKGGSAGPWATQKINSILYPANMEEVTWAGFILELDEMFVDPNHQATAQRKLTTLRQGNSSVEELIQEFEIHGPISRLGDVGLIDHCRWDNGPMCNPPISTSFDPQDRSLSLQARNPATGMLF